MIYVMQMQTLLSINLKTALSNILSDKHIPYLEPCKQLMLSRLYVLMKIPYLS